MYDQVVKCQRAGLCLSEHFLIWTVDIFADLKNDRIVEFREIFYIGQDG